jgi:PAS domain S-box-containing protein
MSTLDSAASGGSGNALALSLEYADPEQVLRAAPVRASEGALATARILLVDDDAAASKAMDLLLRSAGFTTWTAEGGEAALSVVRRELPDVVLTDLEMPLVDGVELCHRLHEIDDDLPVIVVTAHSSMQSVIRSLRAGAEDYLIKPLECDAVLWCVERALTRRAEKRERAELSRALNERLLLSSLREQELARAAARHSAQLSALLENLRDGVIVADPGGRILLINGAARTILGISGDAPRSLEEFQALSVLDLDGRPVPSARRPLGRALRGEQFVDDEVLRVRPNGERRRVMSSGTNVRDEAGNVVMAVVVFRDVTALRLLERQRDEYLALVSHDLRNPLSSISACVSLLKLALQEKVDAEAPPSAVLSGCADRIDRNVRRMTLMLDELTESTGLESPGLELRRLACNLRELVANVVDSLDDTGARRITIHTDEAGPYEVIGDASRLERVVANLVTNALKYSAPDSPVEMRLLRSGDEVELDVVDRGIGLAPESVRMIFEKYYRSSGGRSQASGLGLGLYIAHRIVEAHGGRIEVSSELGKGSTFRLLLPSRQEQSHNTAALPVDSAGAAHAQRG